MEGILLRALKARGVVVEQPIVPESLEIVEKGGVAGSHVVVLVSDTIPPGVVMAEHMISETPGHRGEARRELSSS